MDCLVNTQNFSFGIALLCSSESLNGFVDKNLMFLFSPHYESLFLEETM